MPRTVVAAALLWIGAVAGLKFKPLGGALGLEVFGALDVTRDADALRCAFAASRGLLIFRGLLNFNKDDMVALSAVFGSVEPSPADGDYETLVEGDARVHQLSGVSSSRVFADDGASLPVRSDASQGGSLWQTDQSLCDTRPTACAIFCLEAPPFGVGETLFCSAVAALADVPEPLREKLPIEKGALSPRRISGLVDVFGEPVPEAQRLVEAPSAFCTSAPYASRHNWAPGDFVVWDTRRTMHVGKPAPKYGQPIRATKRRQCTLQASAPKARASLEAPK
ncbi:hypothetical protein M885DRAFT_529042 [Pelagophyceae sp. CCMP2097]|nr:hypothetical protein M885DRAFT_529042 [Pelagophyceae sp. CCMP2097]